MLIQLWNENSKKCKNKNSEDSGSWGYSSDGSVPAGITITVIGDSRVGKTSLIRRFTTDKFADNYKPTYDTELTEIMKNLPGNQSLEVCFHFLDTNDVFIDAATIVPGKVDTRHASFSSLVLIVYDITDHRTFEAAKDWVCLVKNMLLSDVTLVLVGNKADLEQQRQVHRTAGQVFAMLNGMVFVETSAKNGQNLRCLFNYITDV